MTGLRPPKVTEKLVPVFSAAELSALERACAGRGFAQRRDAAVIAVFRATGIRLSELARIRYSPGDQQRTDVDLERREILPEGGVRNDATIPAAAFRQGHPWRLTLACAVPGRPLYGPGRALAGFTGPLHGSYAAVKAMAQLRRS